MATFTINTTAKEDAALAFMLNKLNALRALQVDPATGLPLPPFPPGAFVKGIIDDSIRAWIQAQRDDTHTNIGTAYDAATPAVQAQVKTVLGVT